MARGGKLKYIAIFCVGASEACVAKRSMKTSNKKHAVAKSPQKQKYGVGKQSGGEKG
jgi:hypothetical protein